MAVVDEVVALYDDLGRPDGSAPRSEVRRRNLRHAATAVVVRDPLGRVYVHRRTPTKDVYPGLHDFTAGGVVLAGEEPLAAARRELAEELGVHDTQLDPLRVATFADEHTHYVGHCYVTTYDGPVTWQPEEVAWGGWVEVDRLVAMLDDPEWEFVPDTTALLGDWVRAHAADRVEVAQGWDSHTELVESRWVDRRPRRPETAEQLRREARLLPLLAPRLPLDVPVPVVLDDEPLRVRHRIVPGRPATRMALTAAEGRQVGRFLRILHGTDPALAAQAGLPSADVVRRDLLEVLDDCQARVVPLLPPDRRGQGRDLLDDARAAASAPPVLVHGDLGPEHLLITDDGRCGVIDWGDARLTDAGIDLAWTLHGTPPEFADALVDAYGVSDRLRRRGLVWHRIGPWHEVLHGLDGGGADYVESGLAGVLGRL